MYNGQGNHARVFVPPSSNGQIKTPFGDALYEVGSDYLKTELGVYGEQILGSGSAYVQSNISKYFSNPQYYFQVSDEYVKNKLKMLLFPFLHKGHWMRTIETAGSEFSYKPPIYDINAPDLFSPEALGVKFTGAILGWLLQVLLIEATLHSLGAGEVPVLDVVAYGGYTFVAICVTTIARTLGSYAFYVAMCWESFCMGVFLVKIIKRILIAEVRCHHERHSCKRNYLLLLLAISQIPLIFWLGNVGV
ncbi:Yif1 family [Dillenia turbinata]|uniref:Yif1 family n=1 Tax=Dillenia turbinata TaxID=194707 RepID=A0AAN8ZK26_9MAGN